MATYRINETIRLEREERLREICSKPLHAVTERDVSYVLQLADSNDERIKEMARRTLGSIGYR